MNYYPRYPGHYVAKTLHLTMEQDGAYTRLLDWCYLNERAIPHDARYAITRAMTSSERKSVDAVLSEFFLRVGDGWTNDRAADEIAAAQPKIAAARANGRKGGRPKKNPSETQPKPSGFPAETQDEPKAKAPQSPREKLLPNDFQSTLGDYERADDGRALPPNVQAWQAIKQFAGYGPTQCHSATDPRLAAAVDAGVTVAEFAAVAYEATTHTPTKPFGWVIATAAGRHRDAHNPGANHADRPQRGRVGLADRNPRPVRQAEPEQHDAIDGTAVRIDP